MPPKYSIFHKEFDWEARIALADAAAVHVGGELLVQTDKITTAEVLAGVRRKDMKFNCVA